LAIFRDAVNMVFPSQSLVKDHSQKFGAFDGGYFLSIYFHVQFLVSVLVILAEDNCYCLFLV
jgi:hypothetical protein